MKVKPHKWTHHHTHRLYHASMFLGFFMVLCVVVSGQLMVWLNANADTLPESRVVALSATVGSITPEPPVVSDSRTYPPLPVDFPPLDLEPAKDILLTIEPATLSAKQITIVRNGQELKLWSFPTQFPAFKGTSSIYNTVVLIEAKSQNYIVRGTAYPNNKGEWSWTPPQALAQGDWEISAYVSDPLNPTRFSGTSLLFRVSLEKDVIPIVRTPAPVTIVPSGTGPKSVLVKVPDFYLKVNPGSPVVVEVRLNNFGSPKKPNPVNVEYVIRDSLGNDIIDSVDTISSTGQDSYLKTFNTAVNLPGGAYIVSVIITGSDKITYSSSDFFEINSKLQPVLASTNFPTPTQALMLIFFVFIVLAYFELHKIADLTHKIRKLHPEFN